MTVAVHGQYDYSETCMRAHELAGALRFDEARALICQEKQRDPQNLVPVMLEGYIDFLTLIVSENKYDYDSLKAKKNERLARLRKGDRSSPWYRSSIAHYNLQWAFARITHGSYVNAARDIRKAYLLLEENHLRHPGFLPDKNGLGIMHALIGSIPDNLEWIASIFNMKGSVEDGRKELLEVIETSDSLGYPFLKSEAIFFLSFIELNLTSDKQSALSLLQHYGRAADSNLMLVFSKARIYMQTGRTDDAIALLVDRPGGKEYFPFYYLDYLAGLAKLSRLDPDAAHYFLRYTANFKGSNYIRSAYQRLAWIEYLAGNEAGYEQYMQRVLRYGEDISDGDKMALREAEEGLPPNTCLLKARLLYDGGYYHRADSVLTRAACSLRNNRDSLEYLYRKGRIAQARQDWQKALSYYEETIRSGQHEPYYFAANAALQSGRIHENMNDYPRAEASYKACLKMKNTEYRNSIKQKARAGLNNLAEKQHKPGLE